MQNFHLDLSVRGILPTLLAKQGDVGRKFTATLTDNGTAYEIPDGARFSVWFKGPGGEGNYSQVGDASAFSVSGSTVTVELITQMLAAPGKVTLCLVLSAPDGSQIGFWDIECCVEAIPGSGSEGAAQYYTALSENAAQAIAAADRAEAAAATLTRQGLADMLYPVGAIYLSVTQIDPAALFGGTWERIKDTFLLSAGDKYAAGATGGEEAHVLSEDELPAHGHGFTGKETSTGEESATHTHGLREVTVTTTENGSHTHQSQGYWQVTGSGERCIAVNPVTSDPVVSNALLAAGEHTHSVTIPQDDTAANDTAHTHKFTAQGEIGETGGGKAHNNLPPYLAVYMWQRTA